MAKYTLELRTIIDDPYAPYLFNFDYEFYDNDLKSIFGRNWFSNNSTFQT